MTEEKDRLEKAIDPRHRPRTMTLKDAETELSAQVYKATAILEQLESAGLILGNGHHMRQALAENAVELLRKRWLKREDVGS